MKLELTRNQICNIKMALTSVICDFKKELRDENISAERKEIATNSIEMWQSIKDEITKQTKPLMSL